VLKTHDGENVVIAEDQEVIFMGETSLMLGLDCSGNSDVIRFFHNLFTYAGMAPNPVSPFAPSGGAFPPTNPPTVPPPTAPPTVAPTNPPTVEPPSFSPGSDLVSITTDGCISDPVTNLFPLFANALGIKSSDIVLADYQGCTKRKRNLEQTSMTVFFTTSNADHDAMELANFINNGTFTSEDVLSASVIPVAPGMTVAPTVPPTGGSSPNAPSNTPSMPSNPSAPTNPSTPSNPTTPISGSSPTHRERMTVVGICFVVFFALLL